MAKVYLMMSELEELADEAYCTDNFNVIERILNAPCELCSFEQMVDIFFLRLNPITKDPLPDSIYETELTYGLCINRITDHNRVLRDKPLLILPIAPRRAFMMSFLDDGVTLVGGKIDANVLLHTPEVAAIKERIALTGKDWFLGFTAVIFQDLTTEIIDAVRSRMDILFKGEHSRQELANADADKLIAKVLSKNS